MPWSRNLTGAPRKRENAMDELERRLKEDADSIEATVSLQLAARIDASLHAAQELRDKPAENRPTPSRWWLSSLTGLAAALIIIAILNLMRDDAPVDSPAQAPTVRVPQPFGQPLADTFPLDARPAVLTSPLEEELQNLQSDLEKVRESMEQDIQQAF